MPEYDVLHKMKLFGRRKQKLHDWKREHLRLWDEYVPSSGAAETLRGEIIRICGKLDQDASKAAAANSDGVQLNSVAATVW